MQSTINPEEIEKFSSISDDWWNAEGKFKALHQMNPIRFSYIKDKVANYFPPAKSLLPLENIKY